MRTLAELLDTPEPALPLLREWAEGPGGNAASALPPDPALRDALLLRLQVTTRSTLGAVAYETGGIVVAGGKLRILGSGGPGARSLLAWNETAGGSRGGPNDFVLVADDVLGGFFALNGGRFGENGLGEVHHLAPDDLDWVSLEVGYSDFVHWCLTGDLAIVYGDYDWLGVPADEPPPGFDQAYSFYPFPWTREARAALPSRRAVPIGEVWRLKAEFGGT